MIINPIEVKTFDKNKNCYQTTNKVMLSQANTFCLLEILPGTLWPDDQCWKQKFSVELSKLYRVYLSAAGTLDFHALQTVNINT
jgi:hypothetical protein